MPDSLVYQLKSKEKEKSLCLKDVLQLLALPAITVVLRLSVSVCLFLHKTVCLSCVQVCNSRHWLSNTMTCAKKWLKEGSQHWDRLWRGQSSQTDCGLFLVIVKLLGFPIFIWRRRILLLWQFRMEKIYICICKHLAFWFSLGATWHYPPH